jgi:hypothetical protein
MVFIFLSIIIFGIIIFFAAIIFYRSSDLSKKEIGERKDTGEDRVESDDFYVPVLKPDRAVTGLGKNESIHYLGSCAFFSLATLVDPDQLTLDEDELKPEMEGEIALTSKNILIFDEQSIKRIYISSIEQYRFFDPYLVIKRRNVKKKKDVIRLENERSSFKYILHALM